MNLNRKQVVTMLISAMLMSPVALAQEAPPGPGGPGGPPPRDQRDGRGGPDRPMPPGGGRDGDRDGGPGFPGGPGGPGGPGRDGGRGPGGPGMGRPGMGQVPPAVEAMRNYLELVNRYSQMSRDATTAGIAAVIAASDILKPRGAQAAIDYFNGALKDVKNEAIQRAIHGQLAELYKQSGQHDKALDELRSLMTGAPAGATSTPPPSPER